MIGFYIKVTLSCESFNHHPYFGYPATVQPQWEIPQLLRGPQGIIELPGTIHHFATLLDVSHPQYHYNIKAAEFRNQTLIK